MPEVGQVVQGLETVAPNARLEIKPPPGEQWFIPNIYHSAGAMLYRVTDSHEASFASDADAAGGAWANFKWFVTNDSWLEVENVAEQNAEIGYDGMRIG